MVSSDSSPPIVNLIGLHMDSYIAAEHETYEHDHHVDIYEPHRQF